MIDNDSLIKLPLSLGIKVNEILKEKIEFIPRTNRVGLLSFEFTSEELELIDKLIIENPRSGCISGIELLPNLKSLVIKSKGNTTYLQDKNISSITDEDGFHISKCVNLEVLEIENQGKLSYLDISKLKKLRGLSITRNSRLEELEGLDVLTNMWQFDCVGNELLTQIKGLDNIILNNLELTDLNLDILLFPDAIGYNSDDAINEIAMQKFTEINTSWEEVLSNGKNIKINLYQMKEMHKKACEALRNYVPQYCDRYTAVFGIEQYLAENVKYDTQSLDSNHTHVGSVMTINDREVSILSGPLGGANGAYNAFIHNTCVCEGFTRAMQYLLRLKNIRSHNVHCISGEDTLHMSSDNGEDIYKRYDLPDDGYHSIISIDDLNYLYDDPCWNASMYKKGDKSMPWILLTKEEISKDHTLSFEEKNINNNTFVVPREKVFEAFQRIRVYNEKRKILLDMENKSKEETHKKYR